VIDIPPSPFLPSCPALLRRRAAHARACSVRVQRGRQARTHGAWLQATCRKRRALRWRRWHKGQAQPHATGPAARWLGRTLLLTPAGTRVAHLISEAACQQGRASPAAVTPRDPCAVPRCRAPRASCHQRAALVLSQLLAFACGAARWRRRGARWHAGGAAFAVACCCCVVAQASGCDSRAGGRTRGRWCIPGKRADTPRRRTPVSTQQRGGVCKKRNRCGACADVCLCMPVSQAPPAEERTHGAACVAGCARCAQCSPHALRRRVRHHNCKVLQNWQATRLGGGTHSHRGFNCHEKTVCSVASMCSNVVSSVFLPHAQPHLTAVPPKRNHL
jgi:hypothetical protein